MKYRIYFVVALVVLSLFLYMFFVIRDSGMIKLQDMRLSNPEDIVQVILTGTDGEKVLLEQPPGGEWLLNDTTHADHHAVNRMLSILGRLELRMPVSMAQRQEVMQNFNKAGVKVDLYAIRYMIRLPGELKFFPRKKQVGAYMLADAPGVNGSHILAGRSDQPWHVYLPGLENGIRNVFSLDPHAWQSPVVIRISPGRIKKVTANFPGNPGHSYLLVMDGSDFSFVDGKGSELDPESISRVHLGRFLNAFRELYYEELIPGSSSDLPADLLKENMFMSLQVTDLDGVETEMLFFRKAIPGNGSLISDLRDYDPNRFYLKTAHGDYAVALYYMFQPVMRPLSYFIKKTEKQENLPE